MANKRFQRQVAQMGRKEFLEVIRAAQKTRPEGMKVPPSVLIDPAKWKKASDLPFTAGDRVQVISGEHKNKVGQILYKYPFGNAFAVNGISNKKLVNSIETKLQVGEDDYEPTTEVPEVFEYENLRLVSTMKGEAGEDVDVAIYDVSLGPEKYDPASNTHRRVRFATHEPSIAIPWPHIKVQPVDESKNALTTAPEVADVRTNFIMSALDPSLPLPAISQITNLNNRFRRSRYARRITERDVEKYSAPEMPIPPKTRKLLEQLATMPKPDPTEWTTEIEEFIGAEIKKGLAERQKKEAEAIQHYT